MNYCILQTKILLKRQKGQTVKKTEFQFWWRRKTLWLTGCGCEWNLTFRATACDSFPASAPSKVKEALKCLWNVQGTKIITQIFVPECCMESWVDYTSQMLDIHAFSLIMYFLCETFLWVFKPAWLAQFKDSTHVAVYEPESVFQGPKARVHQQFFFT